MSGENSLQSQTESFASVSNSNYESSVIKFGTPVPEHPDGNLNLIN